ncbi:GlxA family transcriptional regulator [Roseovarius sp. MMSF_3281]|uniref:GlxA family transcriptional regulator n=1 Tax=Roseovarius sp. MMSF_3281 TaxID=3046694 RepID=UPI00273D1315|nr:helix-turn-helix domain-containing protein [Roseovarius sp. MMSF_3281]
MIDSQGLVYLHVALVLCPSFTQTPMSCFADALRLAADHDDRSKQILFRWDYASASKAPLMSSAGLPVAPTIALESIVDYDCIVVCGGLLGSLGQVRPELVDLLRAAHAQNRMVIGLCTGSFLLAEAGLLDGKSCAIHPNVLRAFVNRYPTTRPVTQGSYCMEGNLITCPGGVLSLDVAGHIIRHSSNPSRTFKAFDYLLFNYENPRNYVPKRPYQERLDTASDLVKNAVRLMESNVATPFPVTELADRLATTRTRLTRRFKNDMDAAPAAFWLGIRLDLASRLLLERNITMTEAGYELGFSDTAHFCRQFKSRFKVTPRRYRALYRAKTPLSP